MKFYFVYSSGGGAGDWNAIDRIFLDSMPDYFKDHILIKFGDIYFNHRSNTNIIKPKNWEDVVNVRKWLVANTNDKSILNSRNLILDVGTTKIVSYITHNGENLNGSQIIQQFIRILDDYDILEKYAQVINDSDIDFAVTFDIPNLFKLRTQFGNQARNLFDEGCKIEMIEATASFANQTYNAIGKQENKLLTIINGLWSNDDIDFYLQKLQYSPTKIGIGGLTAFNTNGASGKLAFASNLDRLNSILKLEDYVRVHFLGCGGITKANVIKNTLGNLSSFSVDNTTAFNRSIDGNTLGTAQSKYIDYINLKENPITPLSRDRILQLHSLATSPYFSVEQMTSIIDQILQHQSSNSSHRTYDARAKLIIHNFDVFRSNAS